jgi:urea transport system ATP-binding protein
MFDGKVDLTRLDEAAIANLGIGRKFQKPTVFENLSVLDNLELALRNERGIWLTLFARAGSRDAERVDEALVTIGLTAQRNDLAGSLSHGQKQWLEIGMLLVQDTQLILLDEPVAGMTDHETEKTALLIREIVGRHTVVVVEHDMEFVRNLDAKTTVLHEGKVLAEGTIEAVQNNPEVVEVYLGR